MRQKTDKFPHGNTLPRGWHDPYWYQLCDCMLLYCIINRYRISGTELDLKWWVCQQHVRAYRNMNTVWSTLAYMNDQDIRISLSQENIELSYMGEEDKDYDAARIVTNLLFFNEGLDTTADDDILRELPKSIVGLFDDIIDEFINERHKYGSRQNPWLEFFTEGED